MKRDEADLLSFWRLFFSGATPPLLMRLGGVGAEAADVLGRDLGKLAVRYLLGQGGAHPDVSLAGDRRINQRALWSSPGMALDFRQPVIDCLARMATGKPTKDADSVGSLGTGGELAMLMIADELAERPRADLPLSQVTRQSALAWLIHGGPNAPALPSDEAFDDVLFFIRGRLGKAWLARDPVFPRVGPALGLEAMLDRADQRALAWQRLRERVQARQRTDLLAPLCDCSVRLWQKTDADRMVSQVEEVGRFPGESPRQKAYRRLLGAYAWQADLETYAEEARRTSRYDEDFDRTQVFLAYFGRIPPSARTHARRLLEHLRRTL